MRYRLLQVAAVAALALGAAPVKPRLDIPELVFVSRNPEPTGLVPGLGPAGRTVVTGGRLLVRGGNGKIRSLVDGTKLFDCSDPSVSFDGKRIAFAGVTGRDSAWRIWIVNRDGSGLARVTPDTRCFELPAIAGTLDTRFDDLDPCWVSEHTLVFASTRVPGRSQYADVPVTNLWLVRDDGSALRRLTAERNGAEEPAYDPRTGAIVYARWWYNRWRAGGDGGLVSETPSTAGGTAFDGLPASGTTAAAGASLAQAPGSSLEAALSGVAQDQARALPRDSVNLWQLVAIQPGAHGPRLAGGSIRSRRDLMGTEPAVSSYGGIIATYARNLGLWPRPMATGVHHMPTGAEDAVRWAGAIVAESGNDPYAATTGLTAPSACAPAWLPDGRAVMSFDAGGRGDYGLWLWPASGDRLEPILDLPETCELDATPLVARPVPGHGWERDAGIAPSAEPALMRGVLDPAPAGVFSFENQDVFAGAGSGGAPRRTAGARVRFFALLPRFDRAGGDTAVMVREVPVGAGGAVRASGLPAAIPMFEQLVAANGIALMTAHGPAHVAGANAGSAGATTRCVGCHLGHSRQAVAAR